MKKTALLLLLISTFLMFSCEDGKDAPTPPPAGNVVPNTIFGSDNNRKVFALDANTGNLKWERTASDFPSEPIYYEGVVYVRMNDKLTALDAEDGTTIWESPESMGSFTESPVVKNGVVYAHSLDQATSDAKLYALNANDASEKWSVDIGSFTSTNVVIDEQRIYLYVNSMVDTDNEVIALKQTDGSVEWRMNVGTSLSGNALALYDNVLYFTRYSSASSGIIWAIDAQTGAEKWKQDDWTAIYQPVASAEGVFFASSLGTIEAITLNDGNFKWFFESNSDTFPSIVKPIVKNGVVYIAGSSDSNRKLYAVDALTGALKWDFEQSLNYLSAWPVFSNNRIFVGSNNGKVYALNASDGSIAWEKLARSSYSYIGSVTDANGVPSYFGGSGM